MVTSWPAGFPGLGQTVNRFAQSLAQISEGRLQIDVHPGGEKAHALKCNDAVQQGASDLYYSIDHYYGGKAPAYLFFASTPFGFNAQEMAAWINHGGGLKIWDEVGADFGVKHLAGGNTAAPMGAWFRAPVKTVDDFKGKNIATAGFGAAVVRALGATPTLLSGAEIKDSLSKKTIDGAEWVGPWPDSALALNKAAQHYLYPGLHQPGTLLSIGISRKIWDTLPATDRILLETAAARAENWCTAAFTANNAAALATLVDDGGAKVFSLDKKASKAVAEASKDVVEKAGAADPLSKKAYASYSAFRKKMADWRRLAESPFQVHRDLMKL